MARLLAASSISGSFFRHAFHLIQHPAGLNLTDPVLDAAFAFTLADFQRLFGNRLVWKNTDPDLAATFHVSGHRPPTGFDLPGSHSTSANGLESVLAETHPAASQRQPSVTILVLLSEFCTFWL